MRKIEEETLRSSAAVTRRHMLMNNVSTIAALAAGGMATAAVKVVPARAANQGRYRDYYRDIIHEDNIGRGRGDQGDRGRAGHDYGDHDHDAYGHGGHDHVDHDHVDHDHVDHDRGDHDHGDHDHGGHDRGGHDHEGHGGGAPCFLRGTRIRTLGGERSVEELAVGNLLITATAGIRPIQWIGSWRCRRSHAGEPWKKHERPVRIARSALAPDVPHRDLFVTAGHALFIDDVLIPAGSLVNGTTIAFHAADEFDELEYFHIKLSAHDVIFAEGAPCETLLRVPETARGFAAYLCHNDSAERETHCATVLCNGARSQILARARSAMAPFLGPQKLDLVRARLAEHAMGLG